MAGDRPSRPRTASVRTSLLDGGWEDDGTTDTAVELPAGIAAEDDAEETHDVPFFPANPAAPDYPPDPPQPSAVQEGSVTEVDALLDAVDDDDMATTLATVRREDIEQTLGMPPPDASPYGAPARPAAGTAPYVAPLAEPPLAAPVPPVQPEVLPPRDVSRPPTASPAAAEPALGQAAEGSYAATPAPARGLPTWLSLLLMVLLLLVGLGAGFFLGQTRQKAKQAVQLPSRPTRATAPTASAGPSAPVASSLVDQASSGDAAALDKLEARPALDVDAILAVSHGQVMQRRHKLEQLGDKLLKQPSLASDTAMQKRLLSAARDPETVRQALRIMATLPTSAGPDLLFQTWTGTRRRTVATRLAEQLVYEKSVRARATPALAVALELRHAESCEDNQKLLAAAKDHGDCRSLYVLLLLRRHSGCGRHKRQDCFKCLRGNHDLADAVKAVRHRFGPRF